MEPDVEAETLKLHEKALQELRFQVDRQQHDLIAMQERMEELEGVAVLQRIDMNSKLIRGLSKVVRQANQLVAIGIALGAAVFFWQSASAEARSNTANKIVNEGIYAIAASALALGSAVYTRKKTEQAESEINQLQQDVEQHHGNQSY